MISLTKTHFDDNNQSEWLKQSICKTCKFYRTENFNDTVGFCKYEPVLIETRAADFCSKQEHIAYELSDDFSKHIGSVIASMSAAYNTV
jgi:hypothetical protein